MSDTIQSWDVHRDSAPGGSFSTAIAEGLTNPPVDGQGRFYVQDSIPGNDPNSYPGKRLYYRVRGNTVGGNTVPYDVGILSATALWESFEITGLSYPFVTASDVAGDIKTGTNSGSTFYAVIIRTQMVVWNAAQSYRVLNIPIPQEGRIYNYASNFLLTNTGFVVGFNHFDDSTVLHEYTFTYSGGMPSGMTFTSNTAWVTPPPSAQHVRGVKLASGALFFATTKVGLGSWNNFVAYRPAAGGAWQFSSQIYQGGPSVGGDHHVQEGNDGRIYIFFTKDSTGTINFGRWAESNNAVAYVDFLTQVYAVYGRHGENSTDPQQPDGELPPLLVTKDRFENRIILACNSAKDWQPWGPAGRACRPFISDFRTFPQPANATVTNFQVVGGGQNYVTITWASTPGRAYIVEVSSDNVNWQALYGGFQEEGGIQLQDPSYILATSSSTTLDTYPSPIVNPSYARVRTHSFTRTLLKWLPDYVERVNSPTPLIPVQGGFVYMVLGPITAGNQDNNTYLRQFTNATSALAGSSEFAYNTPTPYHIMAIGPDNPYAMFMTLDATDPVFGPRRVFIKKPTLAT